ncbi:MAG: ester cyclase [Myxococcales bacterium]|nr:ester cyclase [Myxococcales bacterium]
MFRHPTRALGALALVCLVASLTAACEETKSKSSEDLAAEAAQIAVYLETFDDLDFQVFTHQKWDRLHESHAQDIKVHWPDGHTTEGIEVHIEDLKALFVWAPDTRIEEHPIKLGQGEWTAVVGYMEGTFTEPMPIGDGQFIQPTGRAYKIRMATIGHWNADGVMDEEFLFWDNQDFYRQIGLAE